MRRRTLLAALPLIALAGPAAASSEKKAEPAKKDSDRYVNVSSVGLPVIAQGQLVNYVFVNVRLNLADNANTVHWREREPLFRDALVRAAHRTPFTLPNDYQKIDAARLSAAMMREATAITGPGVIRSVVVTSQTARHRVPQPKPPAAPAS